MTTQDFQAVQPNLWRRYCIHRCVQFGDEVEVG
jgi:hypothetical protein